MSRLAATLRASLLLTLAGGAAAPVASAADVLPQPPVQPIEWSACAPAVPGLQCGRLSVPRDYAHPGGERMTIALIRRQAAEQAARRGAIVFNPGGPGGSGVDFLAGSATSAALKEDPVMRQLARYHDLVSFDPRGVGGSSQVSCPSKSPFIDASARGATVASMTKLATPFVADCAKLSGAILGAVSTVDVARDLEQLRAGLGEAKLNFLGFSYGTYLGATYVSLFPGSAGRIVLDGALDPDEYANRPLDSDLAQTASVDEVFKRFLKSTKRGAKGKHRVSLKAYRTFIARLEKKPMRVRGVRGVKRLTADDVSGFVGEVLTTALLWPTAAQALRDAMDGDPEILAQVQMVAAEMDMDEESVRFASSYLAISGADRAAPAGSVTDAYVAAVRAASPDFADSWIPTLATTLWPHAPGRFAGPWTYAPVATDAPPVLVIGTRFDPRTPYSGAVALRQQLGHARLLTFNGEGHVAFNNGMNDGCVDNAIIRFVDTGALPVDGFRCKQAKNPVGSLLGVRAARAARAGLGRSGL